MHTGPTQRGLKKTSSILRVAWGRERYAFPNEIVCKDKLDAICNVVGGSVVMSCVGKMSGAVGNV